ncbi:MAG: DUF4124 domain-containing protein [Litorilituus sp.]|jgi:hypothetical protein|nr:DUF4124 domain-containing protein [Litorilituus sp.]
MIRLFLLAFLALSIAAPVNSSPAETYVWRNNKGELVFSDTPRLGAKTVKTKASNVIHSPTKIDTQVLNIKIEEIVQGYQVIVNHPKNNATIRDNTGSIYISGSIQPTFKAGFTVQLILDDKPYLPPQPHTMFSLKNVHRGEHQIKMQLLNEKGKVIALSKSVTFYMHRASVN